MDSHPQIILIDGPAGSGKTTLSLKLQAELNCQVLHLDYLYNGWEDALGATLTKSLLEVVKAFVSGESSEVPIFDWNLMRYEGFRKIEASDVLIIEGVGAGQSAIRSFASKLYWVEADDEIGLRRVLERDGYEIEGAMRQWKEREAKHFEVERTREFADFIISTT